MEPPDRARPDLTIYVVDDDDAVRDSLKFLLSTLYDDVRVFDSGRRFLDDGRKDSPACVILDIHLPEMDGFEIMEKMRQMALDLPVILITGRADATIRSRAKELGALALLDKPIDYDNLVAALESALA